MEYLSYLTNVLLIAAFITDRIFRLRSVKEYKEAKEAQIANLQQQLDTERHNNDVVLTEMHKKRYENLKLILDEKEQEISRNQKAVLRLKAALQEKLEKKDKIIEELLAESNRLALKKKQLETERKVLLLDYHPVPRLRDRIKN